MSASLDELLHDAERVWRHVAVDPQHDPWTAIVGAALVLRRCQRSLTAEDGLSPAGESLASLERAMSAPAFRAVGVNQLVGPAPEMERLADLIGATGDLLADLAEQAVEGFGSRDITEQGLQVGATRLAELGRRVASDAAWRLTDVASRTDGPFARSRSVGSRNLHAAIQSFHNIEDVFAAQVYIATRTLDVSNAGLHLRMRGTPSRPATAADVLTQWSAELRSVDLEPVVTWRDMLALTQVTKQLAQTIETQLDHLGVQLRVDQDVRDRVRSIDAAVSLAWTERPRQVQVRTGEDRLVAIVPETLSAIRALTPSDADDTRRLVDLHKLTIALEGTTELLARSWASAAATSRVLMTPRTRLNQTRLDAETFLRARQTRRGQRDPMWTPAPFETFRPAIASVAEAADLARVVRRIDGPLMLSEAAETGRPSQRAAVVPPPRAGLPQRNVRNIKYPASDRDPRQSAALGITAEGMGSTRNWNVRTSETVRARDEQAALAAHAQADARREDAREFPGPDPWVAPTGTSPGQVPVSHVLVRANSRNRRSEYGYGYGATNRALPPSTPSHNRHQ